MQWFNKFRVLINDLGNGRIFRDGHKRFLSSFFIFGLIDGIAIFKSTFLCLRVRDIKAKPIYSMNK